MFIHQIPRLVPSLLPKLTWSRLENSESRNVFFTFDDGPTPEITKFVLDCLADYEAKATFFCIGKNMVASPKLVESLALQGHRIGNHTMNHANAWKYSSNDFENDFLACENVFTSMKIKSVGFRPPYGRVNPYIYQKITSRMEVFMWSILSGDYNASLSTESIIVNCKKHMKAGSILVFHDSEKAFPRLKIVLPALLEHCRKHNFIPSVL